MSGPSVAAARRWQAARGEDAVLVVASLLAADPLRLGAELVALEQAGVRALHVDVMDGHFVPNLAGSPATLAAIARTSPLLRDVHLMVRSPKAWLDPFARAGAHSITCHLEALLEDAAHQVPAHLARVRDLGCAAGLSLRPSTPIAALEHALAGNVHALDVLLLMSVEPGFGGQAFLPGTLDKVRAAAHWRRARHGSFLLAVDGGIGPREVGELRRAGAEVCVVGTDLLGSASYPAQLAAYHAAASAA